MGRHRVDHDQRRLRAPLRPPRNPESRLTRREFDLVRSILEGDRGNHAPQGAACSVADGLQLLMGLLDGLNFLSPHPGPLPWGEGESSTVSGPFLRRSLPSQCAQNTRRAAAVPSPRGRGSGEGQGEGNDGSTATECRLSKGRGPQLRRQRAHSARETLRERLDPARRGRRRRANIRQ